MHPEIAYLASAHRGIRRLISRPRAHDLLLNDLRSHSPNSIRKAVIIAIGAFALAALSFPIIESNWNPRTVDSLGSVARVVLVAGLLGIFVAWLWSTRLYYARAIARVEAELDRHAETVQAGG